MVAAVQDDRTQQRPAMNVPRQVLDAFEGLVANEDKKRTSATMLILQHVEQVLRGQAQGKEMPVGVKYIVNRLVSGLASSRLKAREGYFSALCYLLRLHPSSFNPPFVLSLLMNKKSAAMKAVNKDEIRDQLLAELLLCGAVVRSGRAVGPEVLQRVVNQLCAMRTKKSYLDITASQFLVNLMESCEGDTMHRAVWDSLQAELQTPVAELSPSQLWMRLVLLRKHRASPPAWLTSTLAPKNHEALGQTLMKIISDLPKVHPLVEELVSSLAATRASSSSMLIKFWQSTMEHLQGNTSPGKLQILFHILKSTVPHLRTAAEFKEVVTSSVVSLLLNSLTQHVRDLKEAAKGVTAALVQLVKDNQEETSEVQVAVVRTLVTPPGSVRFDQLTGHKVLALMVPHFTLKTLKGVTKTLLEVVNKPVRDLEMANRNYASHTLGSLLAQPRACTPEAATWKKKQLMGLLKAVVLTPGEKEGDFAKDAFFKALGKQVGHIREYSGILLSLVEEVDQELKALEAAGSASPLNDKGKKQWGRVISRLAALKGKECEEGTEPELAKTVFQVLYCQMALHLFVDVTVATESIEEFITCHKEVKKLGMLKTDDDEDEDDDEEEDDEEEEEEEGRPNWVEVVTELLLSLMTQEMHLFRSVVQGLFWLLTPLMTATALSLLTDVLDTEKARELVRKDGEEEDEEGEEDDEKEGSDDDDKDSDEDDDKDDSDDDEDDEEPGEGEDPNLFTLKKKMLVVAGGIDVDVDMDTVPQDELDRMDERLGALFAEYRGKHPTRKKKRRKGGGDDGPQLSADEQSLMHFQTRVCDMLMVYIKAAPNLALQVGLVNPIYKALSKADLDVRQKDLQNKLATVITALEKKKKFNTIGEMSVDTWKETVDEFFSFACQMPERFLAVTQSCYSQLMHCGRLMLGVDEEAMRQPDNFLTTTYVSHLDTFFMKNHHLPKVLPFCEPCTYNMGGLWRVAATLLHSAFDPEVKVHKQAQALKTLQQLYSNKALQGERSRPEAAALEKDLCSKVIKALGSMQSPINGQYVSNLLRLLHTVLLVDRRTEPQPSLAWEEVRGSVEAFRERISKTALKPFRKDYNVFSEGLRGLLNSKKGGKKQGMKRGAGDLNEGANQQENQLKKRKKENKNNLTNNTNTEEGGKEEKDKKKKKKNKKNLVDNITVNEDNKDTPSQDITSNCENTPKKIMVNGGGNDSLNQEQDTDEKKVLKKKKKKKDKLPNTEESKDVTNPEEITEKKKKKKKKDKLTDTPTTTEETSEPQTLLDNNTEVKEGKKKKKKNKLEKRRQEEEEEVAALEEKEQITPVTSEPTPKKKKKKIALQVNGKM